MLFPEELSYNSVGNPKPPNLIIPFSEMSRLAGCTFYSIIDYLLHYARSNIAIVKIIKTQQDTGRNITYFFLIQPVSIIQIGTHRSTAAVLHHYLQSLTNHNATYPELIVHSNHVLVFCNIP